MVLKCLEKRFQWVMNSALGGLGDQKLKTKDHWNTATCERELEVTTTMYSRHMWVQMKNRTHKVFPSMFCSHPAWGYQGGNFRLCMVFAASFILNQVTRPTYLNIFRFLSRIHLFFSICDWGILQASQTTGCHCTFWKLKFRSSLSNLNIGISPPCSSYLLECFWQFSSFIRLSGDLWCQPEELLPLRFAVHLFSYLSWLFILSAGLSCMRWCPYRCQFSLVI